MVGPGFYKPFLDAENFMRKPYGAGEMNMFNYAINLYYLKYLKTTNQLKDSVLHKALDYMNLGEYSSHSHIHIYVITNALKSTSWVLTYKALNSNKELQKLQNCHFYPREVAFQDRDPTTVNF